MTKLLRSFRLIIQRTTLAVTCCHDLGGTGLGTSACRKERDASESLPQANFKTLKGNQVYIYIYQFRSVDADVCCSALNYLSSFSTK